MAKKIFLIILVGIISTFLIYKFCRNEEVHLFALGDSLATGMTAYNIEGYNYNDYLRDYLEKENHLHEYNNTFAVKGETSFKLLMKLINNVKVPDTDYTIQNMLSKASITTIAIGIDELGAESLKNTLDQNFILDYLSNMNSLLKEIRKCNDKKVYLIGLYKSYNITDREITDINNELEHISSKYNINFISVEEVIENSEYFFDQNKNYLNYRGQKYISEKIIASIQS